MVACPENSSAREFRSFSCFAGNMDLARNGSLTSYMTLILVCHHSGMPIGAATMSVTQEQPTM